MGPGSGVRGPESPCVAASLSLRALFSAPLRLCARFLSVWLPLGSWSGVRSPESGVRGRRHFSRKGAEVAEGGWVWPPASIPWRSWRLGGRRSGSEVRGPGSGDIGRVSRKGAKIAEGGWVWPPASIPWRSWRLGERSPGAGIPCVASSLSRFPFVPASLRLCVSARDSSLSDSRWVRGRSPAGSGGLAWE